MGFRVQCSSLQFNEEFFYIPRQTDDIITVNALILLFFNVSRPTNLILRYFNLMIESRYISPNKNVH